MAKIIWKNLCFPSFIKCLPTIQAPPPDQPFNQSDHQNPPPPPSTTTTTTTTCASLIIKNLNTLYDFNLINSSSKHSTSKSLTASSSTDDFYSSDDDSDTDLSPPDFTTIFASQRFFFSSPGQSNSIIESLDTTPRPKSQKRMLVTKGVRVPKYSSNPYLDFRRSMEEMLEANRDHHMLVGDDHDRHSPSDDMEYLHELLLCYLSLNPKPAHKDIISAFTDLAISLLCANSSPEPASATDQHGQEKPESH